MRAGLAGGALRGAAALLLVAASAGCSLLSLDNMISAVRFVLECDYFNGRCVDVDGGLVM